MRCIRRTPGARRPTRRMSRMKSLEEEEACSDARKRRIRGMVVDVSGSATFSGFAETPTRPQEGLVDAADLMFVSGFAAAPTNPVESRASDSIGAVGVADFSLAAAFASTPTSPTEHLMHFRSVAVPDVFLVSTFARTPTPRTASGMEQREGKGGVNPDTSWLTGFARLPTPLPQREGTQGEEGRSLGVRWRKGL